MNADPAVYVAQLPEIGDALAAAFETLHRAPEPATCELLAIRLHGAARHVLALGEAIRLARAEGVERCA